MFQESIEDTVDFPEDDPDAIQRVIEYLYTKKYSIVYSPQKEGDGTTAGVSRKDSTSKTGLPAKLNDSTIQELQSHVLVYQAADKLGVPQLVQQAFENFTVRCELDDKLDVDPDAELYEVQCAKLTELVYKCTAPGDKWLREWITKRALIEYAEGADLRKMDAVMEKHEPRAWSVGQSVVDGMVERAKGAICPACESGQVTVHYDDYSQTSGWDYEAELDGII
jgi:hypothetical protein